MTENNFFLRFISLLVGFKNNFSIVLHHLVSRWTPIVDSSRLVVHKAFNFALLNPFQEWWPTPRFCLPVALHRWKTGGDDARDDHDVSHVSNFVLKSSVALHLPYLTRAWLTMFIQCDSIRSILFSQLFRHIFINYTPGLNSSWNKVCVLKFLFTFVFVLFNIFLRENNILSTCDRKFRRGNFRCKETSPQGNFAVRKIRRKEISP